MALKKKFVPKYVAKIPTGMGQYRYFYTRAEYQSYLAGKNRKMTVKTPIHRPTAKLNTSVMPSNAKLVKAAKAQVSTDSAATRSKATVNKILSKFGVATAAPRTTDDKKTSAKAAHKPANDIRTAKTKGQTTLQKSKSEGRTAAQQQIEVTERTNKKQNRIGQLRDKLFGVLKLKSNTATTSDAEDLAKSNPNHGTSDAYSYNCAYCTMAYELRQRGYDVEAKPALYLNEATGDPTSGLTTEGMISVYKNADVKSISDVLDLPLSDTILDRFAGPGVGPHNKHDYNYTDAEITAKIEQGILSYGEGSRGTFNVSWDGIDSAHALIWEVENGKVVIKDPQVNSTGTVYDYISRADDFDYYRTDNLEFSDEVLTYVQNSTEEVTEDDRPKRTRFGGY